MKSAPATLPAAVRAMRPVIALAAIGSTPRDGIAILQRLRRTGALDADLEVM